ncbi:MAG: cyclic nucleotide-binding domain-containing protein [Chloroflexi bacterium]|nr:cyclic nucleotide-binding domain-containing protein [Chloroflexota bacterium]
MPVGHLGKVYQDGELIVRQGDLGDCIYVLLSGKVEVFAQGPHGVVSLSVLKHGLAGRLEHLSRQGRRRFYQTSWIAVGDGTGR